MMTKQTEEALKMAIEALEQACGLTPRDAHFCKAIQACKDALEQPAQGSEQAPCEQPVAERFLMKDKGKSYWAYSDYDNSKDWQPLYTRPAPPCQECKNLKHDLEGYMEANKALINREWVGLSERIKELEDRLAIAIEALDSIASDIDTWHSDKAIETLNKIKEKNNAMQ